MVVFEIYCIKVQVDLWCLDECEWYGYCWLVVGVIVLVSDFGEVLQVLYVWFLFEVVVDVFQVYGWMVDYYCEVLFKLQYIEMFFEWFVEFVCFDEGDVVVVNCVVGKDCIGILCVLIYYVLGVDCEMIFEDYELINEVVNVVE